MLIKNVAAMMLEGSNYSENRTFDQIGNQTSKSRDKSEVISPNNYSYVCSYN